MFLHHFIYQLKVLSKRRDFLFWTLCFPLVLGTFFFLAFSNIEKGEMLDTIPIAICGMEEEERGIWEALEMEEGKKLFDIQYVEEEEARGLLNEKKIDGLVDARDSQKKVVVLESGINQTVLKRTVEEMNEITHLTKDFIQNKVTTYLENGITMFDPDQLQEEAKASILNTVSGIIDHSKTSMSYTMVEFYTLIAMTCLYGGILGISAMNDIQANLSAIGKRVQVSCSKKKPLILSSIISSYLVELVGLLLLFLYTIFVLHVDYGDQFGLMVLLSIVGSMAGMSLGICIGSCLKFSENTKTGILISLTMLGCFFSGMMGITMKYIIDKNVPLINMLNPANMITDGFYALYYYETLDRYIGNTVSLLVFSILLLVISYFSFRRQKYDSI